MTVPLLSSTDGPGSATGRGADSATGPTPAHCAGPTVSRMILGAQLRRLRESCGVTGGEAGEVIRASHSKISRLEAGRTGFKPRDVADLLTLYGVTDEADRATLLALAEQANAQGWWYAYHDAVPAWMHLYLGLEQAAEIVRGYTLQYIPELLQTEAYARVLLRPGPSRDPVAAEELAARQVALRMRRQEILRRPMPPRVWYVIDEAALRRVVGGPVVMTDQLDHLLALSELPHVTVQIMPFTAGAHAALEGPMTLLRPPAPELPDVVCLPHATGGHYVDRPAEVEVYRHRLNQTGLQAAPADRTRALLRRLRAEL